MASFLRCRRGGAMLYAGAMGLMVLASVGGMMTNYAWQEAQQEELRGALRASISASSRLLSEASDVSVQTQIKARIADFMRGLVDKLEVDDSDITITHNATTQETWITIGGSAKYAFTNLWGSGGGGGGTVQLPSVRIGVALDSSRYEIAVAADLSASMAGTKMEALRSALGVAIDVLEDQVTTTPGSMAAAIVPFAHVVNVADTSGSGQTAAKRRYARMLTGAAVTSASVSAAAKGTDHHYYDLYTSYGRGMVDMTPLISKKLPITESTPDWNLRQTETIDVSAIMPPGFNYNVSDWEVEGKDFWNGCVMARWGAYWDAGARPTGWDATDLDSNASLYPATTNVAAWSTGGPTLQNRPLHLSDDPPSSTTPSTRFTAYSFPDSRIGGTADVRIEAVLKETLTPDSVTGTATPPDGALISTSSVPNIAKIRGFNDWKRTNENGETVRGDALCPSNAILPLTDTAATLRTYSSQLTHVPKFGKAGVTYLHLGIVWGLRTLSPLWKGIWDVADAQGAARPLAPCFGNNTANCAQDLKKTIVILSDGASFGGIPMHGRAALGLLPAVGTQEEKRVHNPQMGSGEAYNDSLCAGAAQNVGMLATGTGVTKWKRAANHKNASTFNGEFNNLHSDGTFSNADARKLAGYWRTIVSTRMALNTLTGVFEDMTPWEVFRGEKITINSTACSVSDAFVGKMSTGCTLGGDLGLDGRPTQRPVCRPSLPFGPYGNIDDFMRVGGQDVVPGAAPFQSASTWTLDTDPGSTMRSHVLTSLNQWMNDACDLAHDRGVSIVGVYFGDSNQSHISLLEGCVDRAGGTAGVQDVHVAPTKAALETAFREIFTIRSNLRFLN